MKPKLVLLAISMLVVTILLGLTACGQAIRTAAPAAAAPTRASEAAPTSTPVQPFVQFIGKPLYALARQDFYASVSRVAEAGMKATILQVLRQGEYVWLDVRFQDSGTGWIYTEFSDANPDVRFDAAADSMISAAPSKPLPTPAPPSEGVPPVIVPPGDCAPTDQDEFVYSPNRLGVYAACIHITGFVKGTVNERQGDEGDGDVVFDVAPDAPYEFLLNDASRKLMNGNIHVEIVCSVPSRNVLVYGTCSKDPDPLEGPYPRPGQHIWLEGRLVTDGMHGLWVELHPLYRWGPAQ